MKLGEKIGQRRSSSVVSKRIGQKIKDDVLREMIDGGASSADVLTALVMASTSLAYAAAGLNRARARDLLGGAIDLALNGMDNRARELEASGKAAGLRAAVAEAVPDGELDFETFRAVADKFRAENDI